MPPSPYQSPSSSLHADALRAFPGVDLATLQPGHGLAGGVPRGRERDRAQVTRSEIGIDPRERPVAARESTLEVAPQGIRIHEPAHLGKPAPAAQQRDLRGPAEQMPEQGDAVDAEHLIDG